MATPTETLDDLKLSVSFMLWQIELYEKLGLPRDAINTRMFTLTWYPGTTIINYERVRRELTRVFGLRFVPSESKRGGVEFEPVHDENFLRYMIELDDATKVLHGIGGEPLNFGEMTTKQFLQAREYVDQGQTLKILEM